MADDRDPADLALQHGYADLGHMTRLFTAEVGLPPRRFRSLMRELSRGLDSFKTGWTLSV